MAEMPTPASLPRAILRWLALCIGIGAAVGMIFTARRSGTGFAEFAQTAAISALYTASIGLPMMLVFRRWSLPSAGSALTRWSIYAGILFAITVVGTLVASALLTALSIASLDQLWIIYAQALKIGLAIAVPAGVGAATFARLRNRLVATEASLHTKELEHQRALGLATEARLASLESRVRPHFLFNALNSAIALIPEDPRRAEDVLERLAGLLRFSLDTAAAMVSLDDELRVVTDYLEIERVRFGDRLRYDLDVPDELRGVPVPAFAVQSVVENSVKHAVSARKDGARLAVRARRDAGRLRLEITDDGPGFPTASEAIWRAGHGLDALRARLDALYGPAARLIAPLPLAPGIAGAGVAVELPIESPGAAP
jgi:two-component system, LytTR family, sensor histidine kinase AlgZ